MEFMDIVVSRQKRKKYDDAMVSRLTGVPEFTYYYLKNYRVYLTKVAYFALCGGLQIQVEDDECIENYLVSHQKKVGLPETNLKIAAETVDPVYLRSIEAELAKLKHTLDRVDDKNKVINEQLSRISKLEEQVKTGNEDMRQLLQKSYSDGVKAGLSKIETSRNSEQLRFIDAINADYVKKIDKLEKALRISEYKYYSLYASVARENLTSSDLYRFAAPLRFQQEELGFVLTENKISTIMNMYLKDKLSVSGISAELNIPLASVQDVVTNYVAFDIDGRTCYAKK